MAGGIQRKPYFARITDRLFIDRETGEICNLEIKTVENELITKAEDLHLSWYIQVQYQMYVLGLTTTYIAVLCKGCHLRYFKIPYNSEIAEDAIAKGLEFWEKYIKTNTPPEDVAPQYEGENAAVANEKCISLIKQVKETDEQIKANYDDRTQLSGVYGVDECRKIKNLKISLAFVEHVSDMIGFEIAERRTGGDTVTLINGSGFKLSATVV